MNDVLIITNKEDITVDFIINELINRNAKYYRFNTEEIGSELLIDFEPLKNNLIINDRNNHTQIDLSSFHTVYFRRPKHPPLPRGLSIGECNFFINEFNVLLDGIYHFLSSKKWLNNVFDIRHAENKINQLMVANSIGFKLPKSLITNNTNKATTFFENQSSIFKPLKYGFINEIENQSSVLYTNIVDENFLNNINRIEILPIYFQNKLNKICDIRVTIVGDKIFPARIDSQSCSDSLIDWRATSNILPHHQIKLPDDIELKCFKLLKYYKLNFAAIDFILDENSDCIFLEINPNGQWAWIEKLLKYPISRTIVNFLLER